MPVLRIPNNQKWINSNNGEYLGSIIQMYNGNLYRKQGKFSVSDRFYPHSTSADSGLSTILPVSAFVNTNKGLWAVADQVYKTSSYTSIFAVDTYSNTPTGLSDSDIVRWGLDAGSNDQIVIGTGTDLALCTPNTTAWDVNYWTSTLGQTALSSSYPTILCTFGVSPALFIMNGNLIHSIGTSKSPTSSDVSYARVSFPTNLYAIWSLIVNNKLYVGLVDATAINSIQGYIAPSFVAEYDPVSENINLIKIDEGYHTGFALNNVVYIVDSKGSIRYYNGQNFIDTGTKFPIAYFEGSYMTSSSAIHRNGIIVSEGKARFLLGGGNSDFQPSGIWVFDTNTGDPYLEYTMTIAKSNQNDFGGCYNPVSNKALFLAHPSETILAGSSVYDTASTSHYGIFSNYSLGSAATTRGWFVTPKIVSPDRESVFAKLLVRYDPQDYLEGSGTAGTIVAKYRMSNRTNTGSAIGITGTWVNGTSFTTASSIINVGNEIFIISGQGNGVLCHVTTVVNNSGTYTITIDETVSPTPSGTMTFQVSNWIKLVTDFGATNMSNQNGYAQYVIFDIPADSAKGDWIQFKIEVRGNWYVTELHVGYEQNLVLIK